MQALIRRYAREYLCVDDASLEGLVVSLWNGHMEIEDLELEPQAMQKLLGLELDVSRSKIGRLSVDVPWSKLQSKPVVIRLTGIDVEVEQPEPEGQTGNHANSMTKNLTLSHGEGDAKSELDKRRERAEAKKERLDQLERIETSAAKAKAEEGVISAEGSSFWMKLATKILDNLQLVLQDIRVVVKSSRGRAEFHLDEISLLSVDDNWEEAFVSGADILRKLASIRGPRISVGRIDSGDKHQKDVNMVEVFRQRSITTRITLRKGPPDAKGNRATEGIEIDLNMAAACFSMDNDQVCALVGLQPAPKQDALEDAKHKQHKKAPKESKWDRARRVVLKEARHNITERKREAFFKACRANYLELFKRTLEATRGWLPDLSTQDRKRLELMESSDKLTFAHIVRLRRIAYEEVRMRIGNSTTPVQERRDDPEVQRRRAEARAKKEQEQKGWFSSWWGNGGNGNQQQEDPKEGSIEAVRAEVTDEERDQLFDTIGYDPNMEEDDVFDLTKVHLQLSASIASVDVRLGPSDSKCARAHLGELRCGVDLQGTLQKIDLEAESLVVQDEVTRNTLYRSVLGPAVESEGGTAPNLIVLKVGRKNGKRHGPLVVDCRLDQPLRLVYSAPLVEHVMGVFQMPEEPAASSESEMLLNDAQKQLYAEDPNDSDEVESAPSAWDAYYAAFSGSTIEEMVNLDEVPSVNIRLQAPRIIVPADVSNPVAPRLELRLGTFDLSQHSMDTWHLEGSDILAKVEHDNEAGETTNTYHLLSDVSIHSSLVLCTTLPEADERPTPRVDLGVELPAIRMEVNSDAVDALLAIAKPILAASVDDPTTSAPAAAVAGVRTKRLEDQSGSANDHSEPTDWPEDLAILNRIASRVAFRLRANLGETSIKCDLPNTKATVSLEKLTATYIQRTFDTSLEFEAGSFMIKDHQSERDVWSPQEGSDLVKLKVQTTKSQSPIFEGYSQTMSLKVGAVCVNVPTAFVQGIYRTAAHLSKTISASTTPSSSSKALDSPYAEALPVDAVSGDPVESNANTYALQDNGIGASRPEVRYEFSAEKLEVKFLRDDEGTSNPPPPPYLILGCEINSVDAQYTTSAVHARVHKLRASSAERDILFLSADQQGSKEDVLSIEWTAEHGTIVEVDPIHLVLDQKAFRALLEFRPPDDLFADSAKPVRSLRRRASSMSSYSSFGQASSPAKVQSRSSQPVSAQPPTSSALEIKLRRPDAPFVVQFLAADGPSCEAHASGLRTDKKGVHLEKISLLLDGKHEILSVADVRYEASSGVVVDRVEAILNPETRRLAHTLTNVARALVELAGPAGPAASSTQTEESAIASPNDAKPSSEPLRVVVTQVRVVTRDVSNEGGNVFIARNITYQGDFISLGDVCMWDEDDNLSVEEATRSNSLFVCKSDSESKETLQISLGGSGVKATGIAKAYFLLTPVSQAVLTTLIRTLLASINAIQELFISNGSDAVQGDLHTLTEHENEEEEEVNQGESSIFALELPGLSLELENYRPKLGNLMLDSGSASLIVQKNGEIKLHVEDVELLSTKFPLDLRIHFPDPEVMRIELSMQHGLALSADPRSLYQLNAALNSNLLLASSARPQYELASEGGSSLSLAVDAKEARLNFTRPPIQGTEDTDVEHFATISLADLNVEFNGKDSTLHLKTSSARLDSHVRMREEEEPIIKLVAKITQTSVLYTTSVEGNTYQTSVFIDGESVTLSHEPKLLRALFEFQAILESLRTANVLQRELDRELEDAKNEALMTREMQGRICLKQLEVKIAPEDVPSVAILIRSEVIALIETSESETELSRKIHLTVAETSCGLCALGPNQEIERQHSLVEDASVILVLKNIYQANGVRLMSSFMLNVNDVSLELQIPMVARLRQVILSMIRSLPSRKMVQRAIMREAAKRPERSYSQTSAMSISETSASTAAAGGSADLEAFDGTKYQVEVTVSSFEAVVYGRTLPFLRLRIQDNSIASGETVGSSESISSNAFNGAIQVQNVDLSVLNPHNMAWEPALEPCDLACDISTIPQKPHNGLSLGFRSSRELRLNLHVDHLRRFIEETEDLVAQVQEVVTGDDDSAPSQLKLVNFRRCTIVNETDEVVFVNGEVEIPPHKEGEVQTSSMRVDIRIVDQFLELPLVDRRDQPLGNAHWGAWVEHQAPEDEEGRDGFVVTIASGVVCCNDCDLPLEMAMFNAGEPEMLRIIKPGRRFHVPPFQNWDKHNLAVRRPSAENDAWSMVPLTYDSKNTRDEELIMALGNSEVVIRADVVRNSCRPLVRVHLKPVSVIENELPVAVKVQLVEVREKNQPMKLFAERDLAPGDLWPLYPQNVGSLSVQFAFLNAPSNFGGRVSVTGQRCTYQYSLQDKTSQRVQQFLVRVAKNGMSLYAPFWVVNGTGLDLVLARDDTMQLLDEPVEGSVRRVVEETWENQRKFMHQGWSQQMLPGERPVWSDKDGNKARPRELVRLPMNEPGWSWETEWVVDTNFRDTDADGWMYATSFSPENWSPKESWTRPIRRRRWVRTRCKPVSQDKSSTDIGMASSAYGAGSTSTRLFGFDTCRMSLKSSMNSAHGLAWSEPCQLGLTVGASNVFPIRRSTESSDLSFYELVYSISEHPTIARTKLCTVSPRVVLVNQSGTVVRVIQADTYQDPIVVTGEPTPLWWHQPLSNPESALLKIQLGSSNWSMPFPIHTLDEFCISIPGYEGRIVVDVRRGAVESTVLVVFRADSQTQPMYRIENVSLERLHCVQKNVKVDPGSMLEVEPYGTAPFAWAEPCKPHLISIEIGGYDASQKHVTATVDLTKIGGETRIALPPQSITNHRSSASEESVVKAGKRHFLNGPHGKRWVARAPPPMVESVLDDSDMAGRKRSWPLGLRQSQASAIVFRSEESCKAREEAGEDRVLCYGDRFQITCTTSDGVNRHLTRVEGTREVGWTRITDQGGIFQRDDEALVEDDEASSRNLSWWAFVSTKKSKGDPVELSDDFHIALVRRHKHSEDSYELCLAPKPSQPDTLQLWSTKTDEHNLVSFTASALSNIRNLEARYVFVVVDVDSHSRIVRISETSIEASSSSSSEVSTSETQEQTRLKLSFDLNDLGVSVIYKKALRASSLLAELVYVTASIHCEFVDTNLDRKLDVILQSFRVDNCLSDPTYANLLKRAYNEEEDRTNKFKPVLSFSMSEKHTALAVRYIRALKWDLAKLDIQLDEDFVSACKEVIAQVSAPQRASVSDRDGPKLSVQEDSKRDVFSHTSMDLYAQCERGLEVNTPAGVRFLFVNLLKISQLDLGISYFRSKVTDVEGIPVTLDPFERTHLASTRANLLNDIRMYYRGQIQKRIFKIIGYALPGNPGELLSALGSGNRVSAAFASIGSLGATVAKVDLDYKKTRTAKPRGFEEGLAQGTKQISEGFRGGFKGLLSKPMEGLSKGSVQDAVGGLGEGMYGFFAKPVSGVASAIASTSQGIAARSKPKQLLESERQVHMRARPERLFRGVQGSQELVVYDLFRTCLVRKAIELMRTSIDTYTSDKSEPADLVFTADYIVDSQVRLLLVHSQTHVALLTFTREKPVSSSYHQQRQTANSGTQRQQRSPVPPPPPPSGKDKTGEWCFVGPEQHEFESMNEQVSVKLLWMLSLTLPTTQNMEAAVQRWRERCNQRNMQQCEIQLRRGCKHFKEQLNHSNVDENLEQIRQIAAQLSQRVGLRETPYHNMRELTNSWVKIQELVYQESEEVQIQSVAKLLALSKLSDESPMILFSLIRAYMSFRLEGSNTRYELVLTAFEDACMYLAASD